jgi:hypothetical protein
MPNPRGGNDVVSMAAIRASTFRGSDNGCNGRGWHVTNTWVGMCFPNHGGEGDLNRFSDLEVRDERSGRRKCQALLCQGPRSRNEAAKCLGGVRDRASFVVFALRIRCDLRRLDF